MPHFSDIIATMVVSPKRRSAWLRYGLAVVLPSLALLLNCLIFDLRRAPYFSLFMASVIIASLFGGLGPGLADTILSAVLGLLIVPPAWTLRVAEPEDLARIALFVVLGASISLVVAVVGELHRKIDRERVKFRDSEDRLRMAQQVSRTGTFEWDIETGVNVWTPELERLYGLRPGGFAGTESAWEQLVHPEDREHVVQSINSAIAGGGAVEDEWRVVWPDGSIHWLHGRAWVFRDESGKPLRLIGTNIDITDRKRAEEVRCYLSAIVDSSYDAIVGKTIDGTITSWNPAAERLYGYSASEVVGKSIAILLPQDFPNDMAGIARKIANRERIDDYETVRRRKDGTLVEVSLRISPIIDASGMVVGASTIARDITERKLAQKALLLSEKLAATARLAATISHEVNNPLAGAMNAVYIARTMPTHTSKMLEVAERELRRAAYMTEQTLGFYRESSNKQPNTLPKLVEEVIAVYESKLLNRSLTVQQRYRCVSRTIRCPDGGDLCRSCLLMNSYDLRRIISNLFTNGIDAVSDGGVIHIRMSRLPDRVQLTIADNGCGVGPENLKHIFEPFFTTKEAVGTGLGLWITQELVRKHNGVIRVRSRKGKGTVFRLTFLQEALDSKFSTASQPSLPKVA